METVDQWLIQWATQLLAPTDKNIEISCDPAWDSSKPSKPKVTVFLKDILPAPPKHSVHIAPLQVSLRYIIYVNAASRTDANRILETLLFAAMEDTAMEVELSPCADAFWQAMQLLPCPSFALLVPYSKAAKGELAKPVSRAMEMRISPTLYLRGRVVTQLKRATIPLVGAQVNLANSNITSITGDNGQFNLGAVPPQPQQKTLLVNYKQYSQRVAVSISKSPIEIFFKTEEI